MLPQVNKLQQSIDGWNSILDGYEQTNKFAEDCAAGLPCTWEPPPTPTSPLNTMNPTIPLTKDQKTEAEANKVVSTITGAPDAALDWILEGINYFVGFDDLEDPAFQLAHSDTLGKVK